MDEPRLPDVTENSAAVRSAGSPAPPPRTGDPGEAALVAALLRRDRKATEEFVSRYSDRVYTYIYRRLQPDTDLVEDCFQQVFLEALQAVPSYRGESSLTSWLLGIARHKVQDCFRDKARLVQWDEDDRMPAGDELPEIWMDRREVHARTWKVLDSLPQHYRILLIWRYWERQSAEEMARQLGKTVKAVERGLARAREQFRRQWQDEVQNG